MAWTEQCKMVFQRTAKAYIDQGDNITRTLQKIAKESGIPYKTLNRWWYEKYDKDNRPKNGVTFVEDEEEKPLKIKKKYIHYCPHCNHEFKPKDVIKEEIK